MAKVMIVKVKEKGSKQLHNYKNSVTLENPSLIALVFQDLETMFNAPIRKACNIFLAKNKFPFSP